MVRKAFQETTTVLPGNQITITHPLLQPGQTIEVIILLPPERKEGRQSILDVLNTVPDHQLFKTAEEVERYLREERDSWDS